MSVSVSMPQLGESVTEGTVTRWLKREGDRVEADEPLLEVSTDKVDTEIPSPVSGVLRGITVAEDETVAVGAELAVIDEEGSAGGAAPAAESAEPAAESAEPAPAGPAAAAEGAAAPAGVAADDAQASQTAAASDGSQGYDSSRYQQPYEPPAAHAPAPEAPAAPYQPRAAPPSAPPAAPQPAAAPPPAAQPAAAQAPPDYQPAAPQAPAAQAQAPQAPAEPSAAPAQPAFADGPQPGAAPPEAAPGQAAPPADGAGPRLTSGEGPYVTPLVRKLATEHGIDLSTVEGTGVGGRIRKQDVLDAARVVRDAGGATAGAAADGAQAAAAPEPAAAPAATAAPPAPAAAPAAPPAPAPAAAPLAAAQAAPPATAPPRPEIVPSSLRGRTEKLSRSRQVIAQRMVESLQTSAQLTTVVEADVTAIARLRNRAKAAFEAREGVKLTFLPFFALATVEALKVHPKLNAVIDTANGQVTYHDAEHLGIAVDTERGLIVPVIRNAGDLNIAGLARKIADLAERTRAGQVNPDEVSGGTFTLTNTGSRGALFDTPIINQPQVGILGTGTVVKRAVVVEDPALGEVIAVRSMVYLALTYDHRLVDGADAARFLVTLKSRLEEGAFETELGL
jgi:pyruvate dehydrogenase E2 component (dihydrolipoamide acetyltransferase)